MLTLKWLVASYSITSKMGRSTHQIVLNPNTTVNFLFGSTCKASSHKPRGILQNEKINNNCERKPAKACKLNEGMWFYCVSTSHRDFPDFVIFPQQLVQRRWVRKLSYRKMKERVLPKLTFNLDPKIPFKEPVVDSKVDLFKIGDAVTKLEPLDMSKPLLDFENSEELKTANDDVRRLFSLEMGTRKDIVDYHVDKLTQDIRRHKLDDNSLEVQIARLTVKIRSFQDLMRDQPYHKRWKVILLEMTGKRNKKLRILRMQDMHRFHWLIQVLGITYRPPVLGIVLPKPTRESELKRLTEEYCEKIKTERINALQEKLKVQQNEFLQEKEATLKWISEQEKKFGFN